MLGGLARWLRLLGHDTAYDSSAGDRELLLRAAGEERILLTRDTRIVPPPGVRLVLVRATRTLEQLREVATRFDLGWTADAFTRCIRCNVPLLPAIGEQVAERVPEYVRATHQNFSACPSCRRVYWPGTHRLAMEETLRRLLSRRGEG
jgi:uncharacterized protein with PIN domain